MYSYRIKLWIFSNFNNIRSFVSILLLSSYHDRIIFILKVRHLTSHTFRKDSIAEKSNKIKLKWDEWDMLAVSHVEKNYEEVLVCCIPFTDSNNSRICKSRHLNPNYPIEIKGTTRLNALDVFSLWDDEPKFYHLKFQIWSRAF